MKKLNKSKGFTLIELMIVVAIIGILAAIAIPNFIRYQLRSKTAEAKTNMGAIKTNMETFRAGYDIYPTLAPQPAAPGPGSKVPWPGTACPAGCNRVTPAVCTEFQCVGYEPAGDVYYSYETQGQPAGVVPEYCMDAIGDLDVDGVNGEFEFQTSNDPAIAAGILDCARTAQGPCGAALPAGEIVNCNELSF